jgi:hypothetical protein
MDGDSYLIMLEMLEAIRLCMERETRLVCCLWENKSGGTKRKYNENMIA